MCKLILIIFSLLNLQTIETSILLDSKPELFDVDKLGNCYLYVNNELKMYSPSGKLLYTYNKINLGELYSIDVSDPMQIMLFYKDFGQVVLLDNHLNILGNTIDLNNLGINSVSAVCKSSQSSIWVYDDFENELIQYAFNSLMIKARYKFNHFESSIQDISFMVENANHLYLNQRNKCIWIMDKFGNISEKLLIKTPKEFQLIHGNILFRNKSYNVVSQGIKTVGEAENIRYTNGLFYILKDKKVIISKTSFIDFKH